MRSGVALLLALIVAVTSSAIVRADADPGALWHIVHDECEPNQLAHGDPAPCAAVDSIAGTGDSGTAVLKDLVGATQFLLIPTQRSAGIDDPAILRPGAPNYFAAAWRASPYVDERAGVTLPREWVSLAINSAFSRSQNQLHIHVDCVSPDVHDALRAYGADVGSVWAPFPVPLTGHRYDAIRLAGDELAVNPFALLADGIAGARADMAARTLVVVGARNADGSPGFLVLAGRVDAATGDDAEGEQLQDHDFCGRLAAASPGK